MNTIVSICSAAHSGSTMLDLMLGNGSDAFSCGEVGAWFRPFREHHFTIDCACGQNPCPVWGRFQEVRGAEFHAAVVQQTGANFVIDSSKSLHWVLDARRWAEAAGLAVFDILLWKNPIDLCYSYSKRGELSSWRNGFVTYYTRALKAGIGSRAVKFDDLVTDPETVLEKVCAEIGMQYTHGKSEFWKKQHHHLFGARGTREQAQAGRSSIFQKTRYSPEFEAQLPELTAQIDADAELQKVVRVLEKIDLLRGEPALAETKSYGRFQYPTWYYKDRLRLHFLRVFPRKYDVETRW